MTRPEHARAAVAEAISPLGNRTVDLRYPDADEREQSAREEADYCVANRVLMQACAEFPGLPADEALAEFGRKRGW